ncbi:MAG: adenylate/guanylate cyclase domain-containing protein, partial [Minwuiales bacterium]|nr:adenylate/guanylate cyclase domain-containing protein [Minwuiales bacterium]
ALNSVRCGLEMAAAARTLDAGWDVRVGIHCGQVVAGVIGNRQFLFDLWGDTVNIAARVSGKAEPGSVVVSPEVWREIDALCEGRSIGMTDLKGKGSVELFECRNIS